MLAGRPLAERLLVRGGQVRLVRWRADQSQRVPEVDDRELRRDLGDGKAEPLGGRPACSRTAVVIPASACRSTASTSRWPAMKPSSASSDTYSARCRAVSCGSARNTGPVS